MKREPGKSFEDLIVWRKAYQFVLAEYRLTEAFLKQETYGLISQLRRAAVSIPTNIAKGFKKRGKPDKVRFMNIGEGSVEECRYYLILSNDPGYSDTKQLMGLLEEVSKLLRAYSASILNSYS